MNPDVSVVIPVFNAAETFGEQLKALALQETSRLWEVVISDNGSTDETVKIAESWSSRLPGLRIVDSSDRRGVSHAKNVGAKAARGRLILTCDADDVVAPGWIEAMAGAAETCDVIGGAREAETLNSPVVQHWRSVDARSRLPIGVGFLPYAVGSNFGCRREVFVQLGGWDESVFAYGGEDVDFSWRAQMAGFKLCYEPNARIAYRLRDDLRGMWRQQLAYGRAVPKLYKRYRDVGAKRRKLSTVIGSWTRLVIGVPTLMSPARRGRWVTNLAGNVGRLLGSMEQRVFYP